MHKADERRDATILVINTVQDIEKEKLKQVFPSAEIADTYNCNIGHCLGCNSCWIKTPGKCVIKDDYDILFQKILKADKVVFISEEKLGMVSYNLKNIIDRLIPLVMPYTCIKNGQARHAPRYNKSWEFMLVVPKSEDITYLEHWMKRVAINFHSQSMGVYLLADKERIHNEIYNY